MRKKKVLINIVFSLLLQVATVISGFIIPRLIISTFGSDNNGLINSITSFIGYISVLQLGVGSVVKASLYGPLAHKDQDKLNTIVKTAGTFFKKIGIITIFYIVALAVIFPIVFAKNFDFIYTASLVWIIGIGTVFTYLYGITYQMLLESDQRSYVYSIIQIGTVVLNTIAVVFLVKIGAGIHIVKAASAIFYILRPIALNLYVKNKYKLNLRVPVDSSVIAQRWDGFAQGLAYYIHSNSDIFVLTAFSSFANVSVYGVYALVTSGLNAITSSIDRAVRSAFGNILASDETDQLKRTFNAYNTCFHIISTVIFSTASATVFGFISVYIGEVTDVNYQQPVFGLLTIAAAYVYCLRMPYNTIIFAAGKFKETKKSAFVEAVINFALSWLLVYKLGLVGVAIGTAVAMVYRTISFGIFLHDNILELGYLQQCKRYVVTLISYVCSIWLLSYLKMSITGYASWIVCAAISCMLAFLIVVFVNVILDYKNVLSSIRVMFLKKAQ